MTFVFDARDRKKVKAAEGYLELILALGESWQPSVPVRDKLARRALRELGQLDHRGVQAGHLYFLRGQAFRAMERYTDAIEPFELALRCEPDNQHIHLALAWCFKRIQRIDLAIQALEDALEIAPDEAIVHYNLACYWALAKNVSLALRYLNQSIQMDPHYRECVAVEPDFDPIRDDEHFRALVSVQV